MWRILVFTAIETAALALWLGLFLEEMALTALVILAFGLIGEHFISFANSKASTGSARLAQIIGVSLSEALIWAVWFFIAISSPLIAFLALVGLMLIQHLVERNLFLGKSAFDFGDITRVINFTLIEALGATIWFILVELGMPLYGILVLAVALLVEHIIQVKRLKES